MSKLVPFFAVESKSVVIWFCFQAMCESFEDQIYRLTVQLQERDDRIQSLELELKESQEKIQEMERTSWLVVKELMSCNVKSM